MIVWLLIFAAAVVLAYLAFWMLLRPTYDGVSEQKNVVEFPAGKRRRTG